MKTAICILLFAVLCLRADMSMAIDGNARDYIPLPPGTNLGILYFQHLDASRFYSDGKEVPGDNKLEVNAPLVRMVH